MLEVRSSSSGSFWPECRTARGCSGHSVDTEPSLERGVGHSGHSEHSSAKVPGVTGKWDPHDARLRQQWMGIRSEMGRGLENKMETLLARSSLSGFWLQLLCSVSHRQRHSLRPFFLPLILAAPREMHWEVAGKWGTICLLQIIC